MQTFPIRNAALAVGLAVTLGLGLTNTGARAEDAKPSQQQRMKDCNVQAKTKNLKGDERKGFMSTCLKG